MPAQKLADKYTLKTLNMEPVGIPPNISQQHLMNEYDGVEAAGNVQQRRARDVKVQQRVTLRQWVTVGVLCFVNLINYMDRYTVAGESTLILCYCPCMLTPHPFISVPLRKSL